jgi:hypothetical protein
MRLSAVPPPYNVGLYFALLKTAPDCTVTGVEPLPAPDRHKH